MAKTNRFPSRIAWLLVCQGILLGSAASAWEPTKPIEFVIPAGTGGGADQMARVIAKIVETNKLSPAR